MKLKIACIAGDGIGPEIVREARKVLDKVAQCFGHEIEYTDILMGGASIDVHGVPLTEEAVSAAKARHADVLICDTAGRLHNKKNLMEELKKMNRIIEREFPDAHRENLIVLDATTGQNALQQAREFGSVADLTGIILTKMDGTAKGGIAIAIQSELQVPVKYIGVGEKLEDLQKFDAEAFVNALFDAEQELKLE